MRARRSRTARLRAHARAHPMRVRIPPPGAPEASPGEALFDSHERATQLVLAMCLAMAAAVGAAALVFFVVLVVLAAAGPMEPAEPSPVGSVRATLRAGRRISPFERATLRAPSLGAFHPPQKGH